MTEIVSLTINGRPVRVPSGTVVAVALALAGESRFRRSVAGHPRGPSAAWASASNAPSRSTAGRTAAAVRRFARTAWKSGPMSNASSRFEVVVVGAGPAGLAAAAAAAESGRRTVVLDATPWLGGQIWRGGKRKEVRERRSAGWRGFRRPAPRSPARRPSSRRPARESSSPNRPRVHGKSDGRSSS